MRTFGKYRLLEPIASGGMAEVWRAEAPGAAGFVKEVALKLIRGDHDARGEFVQLFIREARLASRLTHGNIVQVFEFDEVDGRYSIAMELVRGRTLRAAIDRCRELGIRFGLARAVHVCAEVARALAYAHRAEQGGLVHRDVSPQNVLLSFEGEVKLADFGIARVLGSAEVTAPGTVKGKLAYMAPEQARGEAVDGRADVFSVGVILWELCAGRRLFARDSDAAMLAAVVAPDPIAPPSAWNEEVSPELDALVLAALARDPDARTASADALVSQLSALRLRLARDPGEVDLRALLARLWPDGERTAHAPPIEGTAVRVVATPERATTGTPPRSLDGRRDDATRTANVGRASRLRARRRALVLVCAATVLLVAAIPGALRLRARSAPTAPPIQPLAASGSPSVQVSVTAPDTAPVAVPAPVPAPVSAQPAITEVAPPAAPRQEPPRRDRTDRTAERGVRSAATTSSRGGPRDAARSPPVVPAASAEPRAGGTLSVRAVPWAYVTIDGRDAGETPLEAAVTGAAHRVRAHHPTLGDAEIVVTLQPGEHFVWRPTLSRQ